MKGADLRVRPPRVALTLTVASTSGWTVVGMLSICTSRQGSTSTRPAVKPPPGEMARLEMDAAELRLAAKISDGRFYTMKNIHRLRHHLPRGRRVRIESLPPQPVWNSPWLAAAFVGLLIGEWLLRKKAGLL